MNEVLENLKEFLTNPLLVSLLYTAFEYKHTLPFKKHIFYRQVYDALFESHDLSKGDSYERSKIRTCNKLDREDFHRVLRFVGFKCLRINKTEFTKDEIINLFEEAKLFCNDLSFKSADFLRDVTVSAPLFSVDGIYYKWSHKSLQEYFAAQFIQFDAKGKHESILVSLSKSINNFLYLNVLDIYHSIDPKTFKYTVVKTYLQEFVDLYDTASRTFDLDKKIIEERVQIIYHTDRFLIDGYKLKDSPERNHNINLIFQAAWKETNFNYNVGQSLHSYRLEIVGKDSNYHLLTSNTAAGILRQLLTKTDDYDFYEPTDNDLMITWQPDLEFMKAYKIDLEPNSILNQLNVFDEVTQLVKTITVASLTTVLDLKKVIKYLKEMEKDLITSNELILDDF